MERKKSDSKSPEKSHSSERITSSEETSSDKLVNAAEVPNKYSHENFGESSQKEETRNLKKKGIKLIFSKLREKQYTLKKSEGTSKQTESRKKKGSKRMHSSTGTSSDELANAEDNQIKHSHADNQRKEPRNLEKEGIKLIISKKTKQDSSKKRQEEYSLRYTSTKGASGKSISGKFVNLNASEALHDHTYSSDLSEANSRKATRQSERKSSSSRSSRKQNVSKKNEETSRPAESSKGKVSKTKTFSSKLVNYDMNQSKYCRETGGENNQSEPRKLEEEKLSSSILDKKQHSLKKRHEKTSRWIKNHVEENKRIASEAGFSGKFVNTDSSLSLHDHKYARALSENNRPIEKTKKSERKRPPEKQLSKKSDEIPRKTRNTERNASKNVNYCEDSPSDDLVSDDISRNHLHSHAADGDSESKETLSYPTTLSSKYKTKKRCNEISSSSSNSSEDLYIDVVENDIEDIIPKVNKYLKELPCSSTLTDRPNVSKPSYISPFKLWGKEAKSSQNLGDEHGEDDAEAEDGECVGKISKVTCKENTDKTWEEFKAKMLQGNNKKASNSRVYNTQSGSSSRNERNHSDGKPGCSASYNEINYLESEPGSSFYNERNPPEDEPGTFSYRDEENHLEVVNSNPTFREERNNLEDGQKYNKGTLVQKNVKEDACTQNKPKLVNNDIVEKEAEETKTLKNQETNKELNISGCDDYEPGSSYNYSLRDATKSIKPIRQSESEIEHKKDSTEVQNDKFASNAPNATDKDNVPKYLEKRKRRNKKLYNQKKQSKFKIDDNEPRSSTSIFEWWNKAFNKTNKTTHSRGDLVHKESTQVEDGACEKAINVNDVKKETKKLTVLNEKTKDSSRSRIDDPQSGTSLQYQRNGTYKSIKPKQHYESNSDHEKDGEKKTKNFKILNKESKDSSSSRIFDVIEPKRHAEGYTDHKRDGQKTQDDACALNSPHVVNSDGLQKEKLKVLKEESTNSGRSRIDDADPGGSFHNQTNNAFNSFNPKLHSDGNMDLKKDGTKPQDGVCALNSPKPVNSDKTVKKDGEKRKSLKKFSLEKQKEPERSKIDDAEETDEVFAYGSLNENIIDQNISPVTGQNKGISKRLSDQSNPLKENRQRPSI